MKVYTYYNVIHNMHNLWSQDTQLRLIELWKKSWIKHGWEPVVLGDDACRDWPGYQSYRDRFYALPTPYGNDFDGPCFMRWWAVGAAGGSMLTDYDVINYGFTPREAGGKMTLFSNGSDTRAVHMGAVLGEPWQFLEMADIMADWQPTPHDFGVINSIKVPHCSDLTMLQRMFNSKTRDKPEWFVRGQGSSIWGEPGWNESPLVHYGFELHDAGHWPKCDHIEKLRPI